MNALLVLLLVGVFVVLLASAQTIYWLFQARQEARQKELARRLGMLGQNRAQESLFREQAADALAGALGSLGQKLESTIKASDTEMTVGGLLSRMFGLAFIVGIVGLVLFGLTGFLLGIFGLPLPYFALTRKANKRRQMMAEQLPEALELMARSLQAGHALNDAFRMCAEEMSMPISGEFGRVFEVVAFGREFRDALQGLLERNPGNFDLQLFVSSVQLQRETGGNLIEILESISNTIRQRFVFHAKVRALTSEARFSALILGGLPVVVAIMISVQNPDYLRPLFTEDLGNLVVGGVAIWFSIGVFVIRDISSMD